MRNIKRFCYKYFPMDLRDWIIFFITLLSTSLICFLLQGISSYDFHVPMIFVLGVLIISLLTNGYFYGCFSALLSVFAVNWAFTFPYYEMNFSIYGYPLTFFTMLTVGIATSMLTSRLQEQERLRREAEKERIRANLLRAISHDLRTPLTAISGSIGAVLEDGQYMSSEESRELLLGAKKDSEWLFRMVENLLSITRINGDEFHNIRKEEEILEEVFSEAVINFKKRHPDISVSVKVPDSIFFVPMDAMLIEQVLINILDNAARHGKTTSKIKITATGDSDYISVMVSDNGLGLPKEYINKLFDDSFSLNEASDNTRGMGIGLLVCRTIINAHGGTISAHNLDSGGACFVFTLKRGSDTN